MYQLTLQEDGKTEVHVIARNESRRRVADLMSGIAAAHKGLGDDYTYWFNHDHIKVRRGERVYQYQIREVSGA